MRYVYELGLGATAQAIAKTICDYCCCSGLDEQRRSQYLHPALPLRYDTGPEQMQVVTELNMAIIKIVRDAGAHFAQGAKTIMLENANLAG